MVQQEFQLLVFYTHLLYYNLLVGHMAFYHHNLLCRRIMVYHHMVSFENLAFLLYDVQVFHVCQQHAKSHLPLIGHWFMVFQFSWRKVFCSQTFILSLLLLWQNLWSLLKHINLIFFQCRHRFWFLWNSLLFIVQ